MVKSVLPSDAKAEAAHADLAYADKEANVIKQKLTLKLILMF